MKPRHALMGLWIVDHTKRDPFYDSRYYSRVDLEVPWASIRGKLNRRDNPKLCMITKFK
jgi:hypothetical protein